MIFDLVKPFIFIALPPHFIFGLIVIVIGYNQ
jgi:hypothetical protein